MARVALTSGASAELIVDTACVVAFRTYYAQASDFQHLLAVGFRTYFVLVFKFLKRFLQLCRFFVAADNACADFHLFVCVAQLFHFSARIKIGVAAQQNIRTASCHVGCDGNCAELACLRDDFRFLLVVDGVEYVVPEPCLFKQT